MGYVSGGHFTLDAELPARSACGRELEAGPTETEGDDVECGACLRTRAFKERGQAELEASESELDAGAEPEPAPEPEAPAELETNEREQPTRYQRAWDPAGRTLRRC